MVPHLKCEENLHKKNEPSDVWRHRKALNIHSSNLGLATLLDALTGTALRFDTAIYYIIRRLIACAYREIIAKWEYQIKYFRMSGAYPGEDRLFFSASCKRCWAANHRPEITGRPNQPVYWPLEGGVLFSMRQGCNSSVWGCGDVPQPITVLGHTSQAWMRQYSQESVNAPADNARPRLLRYIG